MRFSSLSLAATNWSQWNLTLNLIQAKGWDTISETIKAWSPPSKEMIKHTGNGFFRKLGALNNAVVGTLKVLEVPTLVRGWLYARFR